MSLNGEPDPDSHILEYYGLDEASDELVYRGKATQAQSPMSAPSTPGGGGSHGSSESSSGSSSYSSSYSQSGVGRSNSLRTSPRSPRGSAHRRLAIVGMGGEQSALIIPSDLVADFKAQSGPGSRHRPTSTPHNALAHARPSNAHQRSASDSTAMARQPSESSVYSDDSTEPELDLPALGMRSSASDRSSQSPTPGSKHDRGADLASPLTPDDRDNGPLVVGLGLDDLRWSPDEREEYMAHRPQPKPIHGPTFITYQPGLHSIAGPPPRLTRVAGAASTPPSRPPRLHSPHPYHERSRHEATDALPPSSDQISARDAASATAETVAEDLDFVVVPRSSDVQSNSGKPDDVQATVRTFHAREGAFPPSGFLNHRGHDGRARPPITPATFETVEEMEAQAAVSNDSISSKPRQSPPPPPSSYVPPLQRDKSLPRIVRDTGDSPDGSPTGDRTLRDIRRHSDMSRSSSSQSRSGSVPLKHFSMDLQTRETPSPSPSYSRSHSGSSRDELPEIPQHERISAMPRTPSSLSMTSGIDHVSTYDNTKTPTNKKRRAPGLFPSTMLFQDILKRKSALERGTAYAQRLSELMEDPSGLEDWVQFMKQRHKPAVPPNRSSVRMIIRPVRAPGAPPVKKARHVSNGSIASEATFPIRPDSYVAQDLTPHDDTDLSPPTGPPALPYPGLANGMSSRANLAVKPGFSPSSSLRSIASSSSVAGKSSGGFFSTLGRKASMNKKPGPPLPLAPQPSLTNRLISRRGTQAPPQPRPINIGAAPTIIGGPRAMSGGPRVMRSHTVGADAFVAVRQAAAGPLRSPTEPKSAIEAFNRGLNGMATVLPDVDREVLAVYLQRAEGKEIEAIHNYISDQKGSDQHSVPN